MSVDPEPRQRTVAELLAENGGAQSGRRRRRRAAGDEDGPFPDGAPDDGRGAARPPAPPVPQTPSAPRYGGGTGVAPGHRPEPGGRFGGEFPPEPQGSAGNGFGGAAFAPDVPGSAGHPGPNGYGAPNGHGGPGAHPGPGTHPGPNGYGAPNGYGPTNGNAAPNGYGTPDGYGVPDGHAAPDGYGAPTGYGAPNGYAAPNGGGGQPGSGGPNAYAGPNGYAGRNGHAGQSGFPGQNGYTGANGYAGASGGRPAPAPPAPGPGRVPQAPGPEAEAPTGAFDARPPAGATGAFAAPDTDGGPPTQLGAPPLDDDALDDIDQRAWTGEPVDGGPPTQAGYAPDDLDALDGGRDRLADDRVDDDYEDHGELAAGARDDPDEYRGGRRRRAAVAGLPDDELPDDRDADDGRAAGTGQAWAMVIAQWVGGAVVGAGVWVGFRYLWYSLPVVALFLAVALTIGLVLGVRALLRNDDLRTTMFAVLVGLLLTVSPALLVLLDR